MDLTALGPCPMPLLAFDSSGPQASVALVLDAKRVVERRMAAKALPSEGLIGTLHEVIGAEGLRPRDLGALAVGLGPGSYTGLRVALASAKGLALGAQVSLYGFSSLAMLASAAALDHSLQPGAQVLAVRDALRGSVYAGLYCVGEHGVVAPLMDDTLWDLAVLPRRLSEVACAAPSLVTGDAGPLVAERIAAVCVPEIPSALCGLVQAAPAILAQNAPDLAELVPNYLRPSLSTLLAPKK